MPAAPKVDPVRRNSRIGPLKLPAEGRKGSPPRWPLGGEMAASESDLWADLWATPQAVAWERMRWTRVVARYVRVALLAEGMHESALAEARQLEDRLGLTPKSMRLLLWEVVADEVAEKREESAARTARKRIKAVE